MALKTAGSKKILVEQPFLPYVFNKLREMGIVVTTIVADNVLLGIWLAGEHFLEHKVAPNLPTNTAVSIYGFLVLRLVFAISTIAPSMLFTYCDLVIIWVESRGKIRRTREQQHEQVEVDGVGVPIKENLD